MKKGDVAWDTIAKLLMALVLLLILAVALYLMKDKMVSLFDHIKRVLRFGI